MSLTLKTKQIKICLQSMISRTVYLKGNPWHKKTEFCQEDGEGRRGIKPLPNGIFWSYIRLNAKFNNFSERLCGKNLSKRFWMTKLGISCSCDNRNTASATKAKSYKNLQSSPLKLKNFSLNFKVVGSWKINLAKSVSNFSIPWGIS